MKVKGLDECMKVLCPREAIKVAKGEMPMNEFARHLLHQIYVNDRNKPEEKRWTYKHVKPLLRTIEYLQYTSILSSRDAHGGREAIIRLHQQKFSRINKAKRNKTKKRGKEKTEERLDKLQKEFDLQGLL